MKKMIIAFLAVTLVFSLIGCDAMLNVMEKMSNNVAGTEKKVIEDAVNAARDKHTYCANKKTQGRRRLFRLRPAFFPSYNKYVCILQCFAVYVTLIKTTSRMRFTIEDELGEGI